MTQSSASTLSPIPHTEQGLLDYIRYAQAQIKRNEKETKRLVGMIETVREQLIIKGHADPLA